MARCKFQRIKLERVVYESYLIYFGRNLFPKIAWDLRQDLGRSRRYAIITDSNVGPLYAEKLGRELRAKDLDFDAFTFKAGEKSKTVGTAVGIAQDMLDKKFGRDSIILALGGGVTGDMAGWIAANLKRGVQYIGIPTSLVAQADSSVGGKTAVNFPKDKNGFGIINQPIAVYIDVDTISTLPDREIRSGLAETIKHGVIQDAKFFGRLEEIAEDLTDKVPDVLLEIAQANCRIKGNVVQQDPHEKGIRRILNYGHTAGHAVETLSGYELSHGECVAKGMMVAGRIAISLNTGFTEEDLQRQKDLLEAVGLPTTLPSEISNDAIIEVTSRDKKAIGGKARYCLPSGIGGMCEFDGEWVTHVDNDIVKKALDATR